MASAKNLLLRAFKLLRMVFGSAGVIDNPMAFARSVGLGIRDFVSVPARSVLKSPTGLIAGMAQGTSSLVSNRVYALSDATSQFSKAAHEGLTGLLQSPIKEAEKHGLPGVRSGIALGVTPLQDLSQDQQLVFLRLLEKLQRIRNRSRLYHMGSQHYRLRLPRPLSRELPLRPYSWEEAVGTSVLIEADDGLKFMDEVLVMCSALKQAGKFVVITERLILVVSCSSMVDFGRPEFQGLAIDSEWVIESEIGLDSVIHADADEGVLHIVGSSSDALLKQQQSKKGRGRRTKRWNNP